MPARRIAVVTGANRGLGREIARQLMKQDVFVVVGARDRSRASAPRAAPAEARTSPAFALDVNDTAA
jgi:NAD(P)-dependent dehydrogenase (short-subunit alcohol dehydrogenase family)